MLFDCKAKAKAKALLINDFLQARRAVVKNFLYKFI